jgi:MFS family permease
MAFNVNAIPVSIGPIVDELGVSSTTVGTVLVFYSLFVAAFVMLGAKLGKLFGARLVFQVSAVLHGVAMLLMALARDEGMMLSAQALAGIAAAVLVPTLVVLALSFRLKPVHRDSAVKIDGVGALLAALAVIFISLGFNNLNAWGIVMAKPAAPISLFGLSPAPFMVIIGVVLAQAFLVWTHRRGEKGKTPLLSLDVIDSKQERSAILAFFMISALGPAVNFLIPLYIQIVQGRTSLQTSVSMIPYTLAIFTSAVLIVRLYKTLTPRTIARIGFIMVSAGLTILAFAIRGDWGTPGVILGLLVLGFGEGSLLTLFVTSALVGNPTIPPSLKQQVALDNIDFVSNDQLVVRLPATTDATAAQKSEAVRINTEARANALKASFLILTAIAPFGDLACGRAARLQAGRTPEPGRAGGQGSGWRRGRHGGGAQGRQACARGIAPYLPERSMA